MCVCVCVCVYVYIYSTFVRLASQLHTMHGTYITTAEAQQVRIITSVKHEAVVTRRSAAIWYIKICKSKQLTPKYIHNKVNGNNIQSVIIIIIIIIIFLHVLGRLTCSGIDALSSFLGASTISSSSRFVVEGVFRQSGVVRSFKVVDPVSFSVFFFIYLFILAARSVTAVTLHAIMYIHFLHFCYFMFVFMSY